MVLSAGSVSAAQGYGGNSFWYFERQVFTRLFGVGAACRGAAVSAHLEGASGSRLLGGATS